MKPELACNIYLINKFINVSDHVVFYCEDHGPFAKQLNTWRTLQFNICPICKKAVQTYKQYKNLNS